MRRAIPHAAARTSRARRPSRKRGTSWESVCTLALRLPGVTTGTSCGTPALHVGKRFLARLKEDGETMAIKLDYPDREVLLELDPTVFYLTDHYRPYPAILVRLNRAPLGLVAQVVEQAWRFQAPKALTRPRKPASRSRSRAATRRSRGVTDRRTRAGDRRREVAVQKEATNIATFYGGAALLFAWSLVRVLWSH